MKLTDNFKTIVGEKILRGRARNLASKKAFCNIHDAKHIGIIYNATEYVSFEIIKNLAKDLTHDSKKISVLGYVDSTKLIDNYLYRKGFDFFSKNELNWYFKPMSQVVDQFITEPFDILINLSLEDHFPIRYITTLSLAQFKAGIYSDDDSSLDLMIDIGKERRTMHSLQKEIVRERETGQEDSDIEAGIEKKTETEILLNFLIKQLLHYLSILKK
jgi:hypothetical protein